MRLIKRNAVRPSVRVTVRLQHWIQLTKWYALLRDAVRFALFVAAILLVFGTAHGAKADMHLSLSAPSCFGCPGSTVTDWREGTAREEDVRLEPINWKKMKERMQ